ncbi:MAG TPA: Maf family protein [Pyrinomonadaceae bacterium]
MEMLNDANLMLELPPLVLASGSPRRAEILSSVGWTFTKSIPDIDESERSGESPEDYVQRLATEKAAAVAHLHPGLLILAADTTVVIDNTILGKPVDLDDAKRMLRMLSGRWHDVLTGVAICRHGSSKIAMERTGVKFIEMSEDEIAFLAEKGDPLDKAGAYAVQAQAALFIEEIRGDYWNVVGLPISLVYRALRSLLDCS